MSPEAKRAYGNDYYDPLCAYQGKMDETTCKSLNLYFKIPKPGDPPLNGYDIYGPENCHDIPP